MKKDLWLDFRIWWVIFTIIYLLNLNDYTQIAHTPVAYLGLFVPVAVSGLLLFSFGGGLAIIILLAAILKGEKIWGKIQEKFALKHPVLPKILFNLTILFLLTFIMDMLLVGRWESYYILIGQPTHWCC